MHCPDRSTGGKPPPELNCPIIFKDGDNKIRLKCKAGSIVGIAKNTEFQIENIGTNHGTKCNLLKCSLYTNEADDDKADTSAAEEEADIDDNGDADNGRDDGAAEEGKDDSAADEGKDDSAADEGKDDSAADEGKDDSAADEGKDDSAADKGRDDSAADKGRNDDSAADKEKDDKGAADGSKEDNNAADNKEQTKEDATNGAADTEGYKEMTEEAPTAREQARNDGLFGFNNESDAELYPENTGDYLFNNSPLSFTHSPDLSGNRQPMNVSPGRPPKGLITPRSLEINIFEGITSKVQYFIDN